MESFAPYVETYPVQWDIIYLHQALGCNFPILEAYSKAVYSRKERQTWESLASLDIPRPNNLGTACVHLKNNQIHRTEGPAVVFEDGSYIWYFCGKESRPNGPALCYQNQMMRWKVNGLLHRTDGPAFLTNQIRIWAINGNTHRQDGPAFEHARSFEQLRKDKSFIPANCSPHAWTIQFCINGLLHRECPRAAKIEYTPSELITVEFWNYGHLLKRLHVSDYSALERYL